jgi:hypothetical protein
MDPSPLVILERAELAARERRLAAATEAESILAAAAERVAAIEAETPDRIASALGDLRSHHEKHASAEVVAIQRDLAALEARPTRRSTEAEVAAAVDLVVAAVLGEERTDRTRHAVPEPEHAVASATPWDAG